jgi:hypothetical protein
MTGNPEVIQKMALRLDGRRPGIKSFGLTAAG